MRNTTLTALSGLQVGHWTDTEGGTGCTVILIPQGARASVAVRGLAPGSRELALLEPERTVQEVHAILLTGGSAFGLAAAQGVVQWLEERGYGYDTGVVRVPIVPAAVIYDLALGNPQARPGPEAGYQACQQASNAPVAMGSVGVGTGATVGKLLGMQHAVKGGVGSALSPLPGGGQVAALAVVNALGDVYHPETGKLLAGVRDPKTGKMLGSRRLLRTPGAFPGFPWRSSRAGTHTTLVVVATDVHLTKTQLRALAHQAHDGLARVIDPVHTAFDGDVVFALSLGEKPHPGPVILEAVTAWTVARAIVQAVQYARGLHRVPAASELSPAPESTPGEA